jgi:anti-sigma factor RsiW
VNCPHAVDVGAYVIDALEPDERLVLAAHLPTCAVCTAELRDLERLPGLLALVPAPTGPGSLPAPDPLPVPSELAFRRLHRSATGARPARHRPAPRPGRRWLLVAAAVVVLGGAGAAGVVATSGPREPSTVSASAGALHVQADITPVATGSRIALTLDGVPSGQQCELTVQAGDGHWETASTWTADYEGTAQVSGTVRIAPDDLKKMVVRTLDGHTLITLPG